MPNYKILSAESTWALETRVREQLELGWRCAGGLTITDTPLGRRYYQAITKE